MSTIPPAPPPPYTAPPPPYTTPGGVPNHLAWAIIATVLGFCLCCPSVITGIVAIVFAAKVNGLLNQGDLDGARRASATARTWCWVTTVLAIIGLLINIVFFATGGTQTYMEYMQQVQSL